MAQPYIVPNIYQDSSNQSQGYFAFRFTCQECYWSVDTTPIRSTVSIATDVMDMGVGGFGDELLRQVSRYMVPNGIRNKLMPYKKHGQKYNMNFICVQSAIAQFVCVVLTSR